MGTEIKGYHQRNGSTYYFFGEIKKVSFGVNEYANIVTNVVLESVFFGANGAEKIHNTITFWDEPERVVNGKLIKEKRLSTRIRQSKEGDKLLVKCYVNDKGVIKAQAIGYRKVLFPIKRENSSINTIYSKICFLEKRADGRLFFSVPLNIYSNGEYKDIFLGITVPNNLTARAERCLKKGSEVICDISTISESTYYDKNGEEKQGYNAWLCGIGVTL